MRELWFVAVQPEEVFDVAVGEFGHYLKGTVGRHQGRIESIQRERFRQLQLTGYHDFAFTMLRARLFAEPRAFFHHFRELVLCREVLFVTFRRSTLRPAGE